MNNQIIKGFSNLSKEKKLKQVALLTQNPEETEKIFKTFWIQDEKTAKRFDEFSENTISMFGLPYGIAPNFIINQKKYFIPMVTEESSVVAAAANSAKFWANFGGFKSEIISTIKTGHVHFLWNGNYNKLLSVFVELKDRMIAKTNNITANMRERGGGIIDIEIVNLTAELENYYQIKATFETIDSMGANFINSCLEEFAEELKLFLQEKTIFINKEKNCDIVMAILSNYTPDCLVETSVECKISDFAKLDIDMEPEKFVQKFQAAVNIANVSTYRATTHNKGIFNGIDAVALATGNDFRALEAAGHVFASKTGKYKSLTNVELTQNNFKFTLKVPISIGTVGGLTQLHPLAKLSLEILGNPNARELMTILSSAGLANNFAAIKSLVTKGIQIGHMKMHLINILNTLNATENEKEEAKLFFENKKITVENVRRFLNK
jgi:hydroxymethylglutaryl-CoA reductase